MISISTTPVKRDQTNHKEINVIDADVDVGGSNATTRVLLMDSDLKPGPTTPVYAVLFSCKLMQ